MSCILSVAHSRRRWSSNREKSRNRSVLHVRKAQNIAIGAEIIEKSLPVSHDPGPFRLSDDLDNVALLSDTLFENEGIRKAGMWACSDVLVRQIRSVEHQVRHGHGMNSP